MLKTVVIGVLIPFLGTTLGASMVFLLKKELKESVNKLLLGVASGVMIAASVWSLLLPAIEMGKVNGNLVWMPASVGFLLGNFILMIVNDYLNKVETEKKDTSLSTMMMIIAVTLHNIPEGMAVGVVMAALLYGNSEITVASAISLAIGIAIQNIPEGAIISMPLKSEGMSKGKSFIKGMISGIVEPIGAIITVLLTNWVIPVLPYLLSFAAGAMIYVVTAELIPKMQEGESLKIGRISVAIGFVIMMILDIVFG